jgi:flagellar hook-length control protein FliK
VNVNLPQIAIPKTPAQIAPGSGTISGKFSTVFAEAQGPTDQRVSGAVNDGGNQGAKKMPPKNDKSSTKPSALQPDTTLPKASAITPAAEGKLALTSMTLSLAPMVSPKEALECDDADAQSDDPSAISSASEARPSFQWQLAFTDSSVVDGLAAETKSVGGSSTPQVASGAGTSDESEANKADTPNAAADQQSAVSSTNSLGTWTARELDTISKSFTVPGGFEASATTNGKPATAGTRAASGDAARGTTSALGAKTQGAFTFLPTHAAASSALPSSAMPANHITPDTSKGQQEKSSTLASSEANKSDAHKKNLDDAGDGASQFSKTDSSSSSSLTSVTNNIGSGTTATVAAPGSVATPGLGTSTQISSPVADGHTSNAAVSLKASDALPHPSAADPEDVEAVAEGATLSASSALHAAKLVAGMEQSELRVGLRAGEFGNVDIRTSLVRNQFTADISVEHGELGRALAAELPSLQHRLADQHLPSANITVQQQSSGGSSDFQQGARQSQSTPSTGGSGSRTQEDLTLPVLTLEAAEAPARLDIHM